MPKRCANILALLSEFKKVKIEMGAKWITNLNLNSTNVRNRTRKDILTETKRMPRLMLLKIV